MFISFETQENAGIVVHSRDIFLVRLNVDSSEDTQRHLVIVKVGDGLRYDVSKAEFDRIRYLLETQR